MRFDILTIFPAFFTGPLQYGIVSRAITTGVVQVAAHDLRSFTHDRHRTVDDRPFGGGEGMVLKPGPIFDCAESLNVTPKPDRDRSRESVIVLSAQGRPFTQAVAHELSSLERIVLICGRYEGVDERVNEMLADREVSIGDYVLSGGELAAAVVLDATARLLPGVLGHADSARYESFGLSDQVLSSNPEVLADSGAPRSTHGAGGLLDYPHYTRPAEFRGVPVPEVLLGGDHSAIRRWRRREQLRKTLMNRPDLLENAIIDEHDRKLLSELRNELEGTT
jgi:tRNA (guanine37-N1)-methyltransferase